MEMSDGEHPLGRCLVPAEEEGVSTDKKAEGPPKVFVSYSWDSENHKELGTRPVYEASDSRCGRALGPMAFAAWGKHHALHGKVY